MANPNMQTTANLNSGTGSVATKPAACYDKLLLEVLRQKQFVHEKLAQKRDMPKNYGDTIQFRRITKLQPKLTPLVEGVTPDSSTGGVTAISVSTKQYGDWMEFTDVVDFQMVDPIITEYVKEQGHQAAETLDIVMREVLNSGTNVFYAGGKTSRATLAAGDKFSIKDLRAIVRNFKKNHVRPALGGNYVCMISPDTEYDLYDDAEFRAMMEIGNNNTPLINGEITRMYSTAFMTTVNAKQFTGAGAASVDVQSALVIGANAYGVTKISGEGSVKSIVKGLGSSGTADPLNQRQTIGWKVNAFAGVILEQLAIVRYEHVASK